VTDPVSGEKVSNRIPFSQFSDSSKDGRQVNIIKLVFRVS
jgi:hypothetical protein